MTNCDTTDTTGTDVLQYLDFYMKKQLCIIYMKVLSFRLFRNSLHYMYNSAVPSVCPGRFRKMYAILSSAMCDTEAIFASQVSIEIFKSRMIR